MLASFCFIAPLRYDGDQIFSFVACMVLAALSTFYPVKRQVDTSWLAILFVFACSTALWEFAWFKIYALAIVFVALVALKAFAERTDLDLKWFGKTLFVMCLLTWAHVEAQHRGWDPVYAVASLDKGGVFFKPWALGCFAALAVPFLYAANRWAPVVALPLLWHSRSTLCVAAGLIGWLCFLPTKTRRIFFGLLPLVVLGYIALVDREIESHRLQMWKNAWQYVQETPWLGHGWVGWKNAGFYHVINGENIVQPWAHNEFYQVLFDLGRVGLGILVGWLLVLWLGVRKELKVALFILALLCFFHPVFRWGRLVIFPMLVLGFCVADAKKIYSYKGAQESWAAICQRVSAIRETVRGSRKRARVYTKTALLLYVPSLAGVPLLSFGRLEDL